MSVDWWSLSAFVMGVAMGIAFRDVYVSTGKEAWKRASTAIRVLLFGSKS